MPASTTRTCEYLPAGSGISYGHTYITTRPTIIAVLPVYWLYLLIGTLLYAIGFAMYGVVAWYPFFLLAMVIITIGEMIVVPVSQGLAANFAPEQMRGRYMAVFSFSWAIPSAIGPGAAGIILDNYNPNLLWYIGGVLCAFSALSYYMLHLRLHKETRFAPQPAEQPASA